MHPVTPEEKERAFLRVKSSLDSLVHDGIISLCEHKVLINRAIKAFDIKIK
jgi:hypothetical protein